MVLSIELVFANVPSDIQDAIADIHIEDQSEADASSIRLASTRIQPLTIRKSQPFLTVELDLKLDQRLLSTRELSLIVRVKGHTRDEQPIEFLNTTTTPLPDKPSASVTILLSRIV